MIIMTIHKTALMLAIILGIGYFAKRAGWLKWSHRVCGLTAILSFILYIVVYNFTNPGYFIYVLMLCLTSTIPYLVKKRGIHIGLAVLSLVWLALIHIL